MEVLLWFGYVYAYKVRQRELGKRVGLVSSAETEVGLVSSAETEVGLVSSAETEVSLVSSAETEVSLVSSAETEVGLVSSAETEVVWWFGYVVAFGLDRVNRGDGN
jgi:hypothetical protein